LIFRNVKSSQFFDISKKTCFGPRFYRARSNNFISFS
jgi:hypothetical protein